MPSKCTFDIRRMETSKIDRFAKILCLILSNRKIYNTMIPRILSLDWMENISFMMTKDSKTEYIKKFAKFFVNRDTENLFKYTQNLHLNTQLIHENDLVDLNLGNFRVKNCYCGLNIYNKLNLSVMENLTIFFDPRYFYENNYLVRNIATHLYGMKSLTLMGFIEKSQIHFHGKFKRVTISCKISKEVDFFVDNNTIIEEMQIQFSKSLENQKILNNLARFCYFKLSISVTVENGEIQIPEIHPHLCYLELCIYGFYTEINYQQTVKLIFDNNPKNLIFVSISDYTPDGFYFNFHWDSFYQNQKINLEVKEPWAKMFKE